MKTLEKKLHLEHMETYEAKVDEWILKGIKAAEQKALTAVKTGAPLSSSDEKLQSVLVFVTQQLAAYGQPQKAADDLAKLIEAKLFDVKKEAEAAVAARAVVTNVMNVAAKTVAKKRA